MRAFVLAALLFVAFRIARAFDRGRDVNSDALAGLIALLLGVSIILTLIFGA